MIHKENIILYPVKSLNNGHARDPAFCPLYIGRWSSFRGYFVWSVEPFKTALCGEVFTVHVTHSYYMEVTFPPSYRSEVNHLELSTFDKTIIL